MTPRVGIVLEERFERTRNGDVYSPSGFGIEFWARYQRVFPAVTIIGRCAEVADPTPRAKPISGSGISFVGIPSFRGPAGLARNYSSVRRALKDALADVDCAILRLPGTLGSMAENHLKRRSMDYGVELVGDPDDVFRSGIGSIWAPILRSFFVTSTQRLCRNACCVSYVTQRTLQARYPAGDLALSVSCSSIDLPEQMIVSTPRLASDFFAGDRPLLFSAGSMAVPYKGFDTLIDAAMILSRRERAVDITIAGDGGCRADLQRRIDGLGLQCVRLIGNVDRALVLDRMRACDLYVQPSRTEGLPRTIIEAFSQGAPVVATAVGGIPELLEDRFMVPSNDPTALADLIEKTLLDRALLSKMSADNLAKARYYSVDSLERKRLAFYTHLRTRSNRE
jgi:phosphatidyl-myo-inositol dimannoside synthase